MSFIVKIYPAKEGGSLMAYAQLHVVIHGTESDPDIKINGIRIMEGKAGLWAGFPQTQDKNGKYWPVVSMSQNFYDSAQTAILDAFRQQAGQPATPKPKQQQSANGPAPTVEHRRPDLSQDEDLPF